MFPYRTNAENNNKTEREVTNLILFFYFGVFWRKPEEMNNMYSKLVAMFITSSNSF